MPSGTAPRVNVRRASPDPDGGANEEGPLDEAEVRWLSVWRKP
jgi:hypothetical protein